MLCPYEAAVALRDAGELQAAYRAFRALGANRAREETAGLLRAAAQPIPRGPRHTATPRLSDTERSICRMVADGATNAAIAATLNIGERTVETHIGRIYEKIGRRGRAALATWWAEQERQGALSTSRSVG
jgi:DNA-binding CsgD family transcriptional regulator